MSLSFKLKLYKMMVTPAAVFGSATWSVAETDVKRLSA